jgi:transposase
MSLQPSSIPPVPEETARVARAAFRKGNVYIRLRDELGALYEDADFAQLFPAVGPPGLPPWRLALVTVMQFLEGLSDRQAADAVRGRIDWKYALSLELTDPGFDFSVLSEFRGRLVAGAAEQLLLGRMLERFRERSLVKARGRQRTDSTHVLGSLRVLNRLELLGETLRAALNALATEAPEWVRSVAPAEWFQRYAHRIEESRLPRGKEAREAYARSVGENGFALLEALEAPGAPAELKHLPAIEILRRVWQRHFECTLDGKLPAGGVRLRADRELARAAEALESPYETEARFRTKRSTSWTGYMVHFSETCDPEDVHLITHVETTPASVHEAMRTAEIHQALEGKGLPPKEHLVDAAYVSAEVLVSGPERHGISVVGPPRPKPNWQAKMEGAYTAEHFHVDWENRCAVCPQGKSSIYWRESQRRSGDPFVIARFDATDCSTCDTRHLCTRSARHPRQLFLKPQAQYEALQAMRERITSEEGRELYRVRAGVEGTISQAIRISGLRQARYRGLKKTHLQNVATAAAVNVARLGAWWEGRPHAPTRVSRFARLAA